MANAQDRVVHEDAESGGTAEPTDDGEEVIRLEHVTKRFGDITAAEDISMTIMDGDYVTLLGPSGAGKTTLLHMISGFITPTEGEIYINDEPISDKAPYERDIGLVFQDLSLFPHMTVKENITFPLKMRRRYLDSLDERVREVLELVQLPSSYMDKSVTDLSGGEQQRVAIARAIVYDPTLLLLDEPLSSLDKKLREEMRGELKRIHRETDLTIVHVTHNQTEALSMADRIAVLESGQIVQLAPSQELYSEPATPFVADFIGNTTLFEGTFEGDCIVDVDGMSICISHSVDAAAGDGITLGLRSEKVHTAPLIEELGTDNRFGVEVIDVDFEGQRIHYELQHPSGQTFWAVELNDNEDVLHNRGETIAVGWDADDVFVYL